MTLKNRCATTTPHLPATPIYSSQQSLRRGKKNIKNITIESVGNEVIEEGVVQSTDTAADADSASTSEDAVNNEEKKVQEKVNLQKIQGKPKESDKDW